MHHLTRRVLTPFTNRFRTKTGVLSSIYQYKRFVQKHLDVSNASIDDTENVFIPDRDWIVSDKRIIQYTRMHSLKETEFEKELREITSKHRFSIMQISPEQAHFMAWLCKTINAKRTIEIGVYTGYSALVVANALPEDGKLIALDNKEEYVDIGRPIWKKAKVDHKIDVRIGEALEHLDKMLENGEEGCYDFALIDADKLNYHNYFERLLKLVRKGGIIMVDDVLWFGQIYDPDTNDEGTKALRVLNEKLHKDKRVDITLVPMCNGFTLCRVL